MRVRGRCGAVRGAGAGTEIVRGTFTPHVRQTIFFTAGDKHTHGQIWRGAVFWCGCGVRGAGAGIVRGHFSPHTGVCKMFNFHGKIWGGGKKGGERGEKSYFTLPKVFEKASQNDRGSDAVAVIEVAVCRGRKFRSRSRSTARPRFLSRDFQANTLRFQII